MTDTRPVWLDQEQRNTLLEIGALQDIPEYIHFIERLLDAWDAAPADPKLAVLTAIDQGYITDADEAEEILRALGAPDA